MLRALQRSCWIEAPPRSAHMLPPSHLTPAPPLSSTPTLLLYPVQDFMSQPIEELAREVFSDLGDVFEPALLGEDQEEEEEEEQQQQQGEALGGAGGAAAARGGSTEDSSFMLEDLISDLGDFGIQGDEEEEAGGSAAAAAVSGWSGQVWGAGVRRRFAALGCGRCMQVPCLHAGCPFTIPIALCSATPVRCIAALMPRKPGPQATCPCPPLPHPAAAAEWCSRSRGCISTSCRDVCCLMHTLLQPALQPDSTGTHAATAPVQVRCQLRGAVKVDHRLHTQDVQAASCHIGGQQEGHLALQVWEIAGNSGGCSRLHAKGFLQGHSRGLQTAPRRRKACRLTALCLHPSRPTFRKRSSDSARRRQPRQPKQHLQSVGPLLGLGENDGAPRLE